YRILGGLPPRCIIRRGEADLGLVDVVPPRLCAPGIWQIKLPLASSFLKTVNAYILEDEHGVAIVDCGLPTQETWELVTRSLDELNIPIGHIDRILLTHAHTDHSG